jgi:hypothetical protein
LGAVEGYVDGLTTDRWHTKAPATTRAHAAHTFHPIATCKYALLITVDKSGVRYESAATSITLPRRMAASQKA